MNLTTTDKKILKILLAPARLLHLKGSPISNEAISTKLRIPLQIVKQRRKLLEGSHLQFFYDMNLANVGWRRIDLLISTQRGITISLARRLLKQKHITYVGRSIGQQTIDLRAELIVKDNSQLLDYLEQVKAMDGVKDIMWSEIVQVVGRKGSVPAEIIDTL